MNPRRLATNLANEMDSTMNTTTQRKRAWLAASLLFLLALPWPAQAFYNPQPGRWLNRDPIGEEGGANAFLLADNQPIDAFDALGLLQFASEGRAYYDGPWLITGQVSRSSSESGEADSASAYFRQSVVEIKGCTGGICNSGGTGRSASFIQASVKNDATCKVTVECDCTVRWFITNHTPQQRGRKGFVVEVTVLGHMLRKEYRPKPLPNGSWYAFGAGSFSRRASFTLASGAEEKLYYGIDLGSTSAPEIPGAGFSEDMSGECLCEAKL
jgi:hypothetical protein